MQRRGPGNRRRFWRPAAQMKAPGGRRLSLGKPTLPRESMNPTLAFEQKGNNCTLGNGFSLFFHLPKGHVGDSIF